MSRSSMEVCGDDQLIPITPVRPPANQEGTYSRKCPHCQAKDVGSYPYATHGALAARFSRAHEEFVKKQRYYAKLQRRKRVLLMTNACLREDIRENAQVIARLTAQRDSRREDIRENAQVIARLTAQRDSRR